MKLRYLPNYITVGRILLTTVLIFLVPFSTASIVVLFIAIASDVMDGPLARNIEGAKTELGAIMDSIADIYLVVVCVFVLVPHMEIWQPFGWMILVTLSFKLCSAIPAVLKHRQVFFLHSLPVKFQGILLISVAVFYTILGGGDGMNIYLGVVIVLINLITIEEIITISLMAYPHKNIRGSWEIKRINEEFRQGKRRY
jgi:CDP-diacylglycerol--glycerol-3-phosphate 3-phosphatidyltransferase